MRLSSPNRPHETNDKLRYEYLLAMSLHPLKTMTEDLERAKIILMSEGPLVESFHSLSYEKFKERASDARLSPIEKVGFPSSYRLHREDLIFKDIKRKIDALDRPQMKIMDLGCGCSGLPQKFIEYARNLKQELWLIDSQEMLNALNPPPFVHMLSGRFPSDHQQWIENHISYFDVVICYSVFHYLRAENEDISALSAILQMLKPKGVLLLGDLPNFSMKRNFILSSEGQAYHAKNFPNTAPLRADEIHAEPGSLDDQSISELCKWFQTQGCLAEILGQSKELPFAGRRQDMKVTKS